ncbi:MULTISPECIES: hypothetical protein [Metabacillus]|uniref:Uncharacterized protein n=2 Tax=Metabacillus TaxID=2675233 RepID=A0A179STT2_9BACI|nr:MULTISPECIES: hypothetical protein [Metabacillus]OAS85216.1 hypothetical protein A6K24_06835 [Metabacillus litoralis]QNF26119.1 hypothetical protein HUW50_00265 [Metabacillus sp. KUDC1714]
MKREYKKQGYHLFKRIMYLTLEQYNRHHIYGKNSKQAKNSMKQLQILMDLRDEHIESYKRERHPKNECLNQLLC